LGDAHPRRGQNLTWSILKLAQKSKWSIQRKIIGILIRNVILFGMSQKEKLVFIPKGLEVRLKFLKFERPPFLKEAFSNKEPELNEFFRMSPKSLLYEHLVSL